MIHPLSVVDPGAILSDDTTVWQFSTVREGVRTGARCVIGSGCYVGSHTGMGDDVRIQDKCHLTDRTTIGNRVFFGPGVVTMNDRHPKVNNPDYVVEPPIIEDDVTIGAAAVILPGVRLCRGCIVGAGAVVTKDVPPGTTVIGFPARMLGQLPVEEQLRRIMEFAKETEDRFLGAWQDGCS